VLCALCSVLCALCSVLYALCSMLCALCSVLCALCIIWLCWQFFAAAFWTTFYGFVDNFLRWLFRRLCWHFLRLFVLLYMQYKVHPRSTKVCCTFWGGGGETGGGGVRGCVCKSYSMDSLLLSKINIS
jgi:hypothetical protein